MKPVHLTRLFLPLCTAIALTGCLDSGSSGSDDTRTGRIHYLGVGGLDYTTNSQAGTTNERGEFRYYPGETLALRVGNLPIIDGVPAREFVTFLDFQPGLRETLKTAGVNDLGLKDHTVVEDTLRLNNTELQNRTRFLMALNWTENIDENEGIDIRPRVISQLNEALASPDIPDTLDFSVSAQEFTAPDSPANRILRSICFYPEGDRLCGEPPSQEEIDLAPERPENDDDINPNLDYKEDLQALADRIREAVRTLDDADSENAETYLERELDKISNHIGRRYVLDNYLANHPASDTAIKSVKVRKIGGEASLAEMEAISTRPADVAVHSWSWQNAEVEYFVAGATGGDSEILINFRPEGSYRWVTKQIRVVID